MVEWGKAKERTQEWPAGIAAAGWRAAPDWVRALSRFLQGAADRIREWSLIDVGPGRLIPWLPIAFGIGIVLYFTADREPAWWAGLALTAACVGSAVLVRRRPVAFPIVVGLAAIAAGFTTATIKGVRVSHPVLAFPVSGVELSGYVEVREERERSDRFVLAIHRMEGARSGVRLERVRLYVRKGTAPLVGSFVTLKARLNPPLAPLRPGGYDFARDLYFQRIGASGFVLGALRDAEPPAPPGLWLRYAAAISMMRDAIDARIRAVVPGDKGAIASALITGKRDAISAPVNEAMYVSSLAHVLSISGYHMAVVAGVVFFAIRAAFALIPAFANRYPIKKWAAAAALAMAAFYLALSGAEVATQRAFIMTAIVLIGVMFDRPALTLRTIAVAALAVMLIAPEAVVHPSFQMSFAATLALIAAYEKGLPWFSAVPETSLGARMALWGGRELVGLVLASLVAGLATTLFAAYHFHRLAPYGVIANLLAMPIVSGWVMPAGLLALIAIPFGFDGPLWRLMGEGIGWMIAVATFVASLPGAVGRIPAFGIGAVLAGTAGLILLCLLRSPLRWCGIALLALTIVLALRAPLPDILVSSDGRLVAVRGADGRLRVMKTGSDDFAVKDWLAADGDARNARDATLAEGTRCDNIGCVARLADGRAVTLSLTAEALAEDCERAAIVVSPRQALAGCGALTIDRDVWRRSGATSLKWNGTSFDILAANPPGYERPWMRAVQGQTQQSPSAGAAPISRPAPRDATPRPEDIEAGD